MSLPTDDAWDALSPGVIDHLVYFLKSTRRWRRDGPSLRRLNRHWCYQLNQHFTEIHPHDSHQLLLSDIASLSKFPRLSYLDAVAFTEDSNGAGFRSAVDAIGRHPSISSLKLPGHKLAILSDADLENLSKITSLEVTQMDRNRKETAEQAMQLSLKQLVTWCSTEELNPLVSSGSTLKVLMASVYPKLPEIDVVAFNRLDALYLKLPAFQETIEFTKLPSLVALELSLGHHRLNAIALRQLPKLKRLSIMNPAIETFYDVEFTELVKQLEALEIGITGSHTQMIDLPNFIDGPIQLQSLLLTKCHINTQLLMTHLGSVKHLSIKRCTMVHTGDWLLSMPGLTKLCLIGSRADGSILPQGMPLNFDIQLYSRLKVLMLGDCGEGGQHLDTITQLKGLEVLGLYHQTMLDYERYLCLEQLTNLRELGLFGAAVASGVKALLLHDFVAELEELWLDTSLIGLWDKASLGDIHAFSGRLSHRIPHLKMTTRGNACIRFLDKHHSLDMQGEEI